MLDTTCGFLFQIYTFVYKCALQRILSYQWLEDSLKSGERVLEDNYSLRLELEGDVSSSKSSDDEPSPIKKMRYSHEAPESPTGSGSSVRSLSPERTSPSTLITDVRYLIMAYASVKN